MMQREGTDLYLFRKRDKQSKGERNPSKVPCLFCLNVHSVPVGQTLVVKFIVMTLDSATLQRTSPFLTPHPTHSGAIQEEEEKFRI
jgi:hypothetical protein